MVGSPVLVSSAVLFVRKQAFERKFKGIAEERHSRSLHRSPGLNTALSSSCRKSRSPQTPRDNTDLENQFSDKEGTALSVSIPVHGQNTTRVNSSGISTSVSAQGCPGTLNPTQEDDHIQWVDDDQITIGGSQRPRKHTHRIFPMAGVGARPDLDNDPRDILPDPSLYEGMRISFIGSALKGTQKYFLSRGFISRNSQFYGLTPSDREKLGGVEYKAVSFLSVIVPLYFVLFNALGIVGVGSWISINRPWLARENGLSPFWVGAFFAASAFGNSGMALLDANATALQTR